MDFSFPNIPSSLSLCFTTHKNPHGFLLRMSRTQKLVNLQVLIDCEESFDIQNLAVCICEQPKDKGDLGFLPVTPCCEIVEYVGIREVKNTNHNP